MTSAHAQEHRAFAFFVSQWSQLLTHTPFANHATSNLSCAFDIVCRTSCEVFVDQSFCSTTTEGECNPVFSLRFREADLIFLWQSLSQTQSHTTRDDRHFMNRIQTWKFKTNKRVTCFMISRHFFIFFRDHHRSSFRSHDDFVFCFFEVFHL
ncbi:hypothetical protein D3C72_1571360 [compost metagenome]